MVILQKCNYILSQCAVSRQREVSILLSQPKSTPTSSRRSSVSSHEDSIKRPSAGLNTSKLNRQLSNLTRHSACNNGSASRLDNLDATAAGRLQLAARESGRRQVPIMKMMTQNNTVHKAVDTVMVTTKPQTAQSRKTPSSPMLGTSSTMSTTSKQASRKPPQAVNCQTASCKDEVTIARHKPTASST